MSYELKAPPLVGTYGRAGVGKTGDKIRAFPDAFYVASPGGLVTAVSLVGHSPPEKRVLDISTVVNLDAMRAGVEKAVKADRAIKQVVIDDLSMIAERTERELKAVKKDGRQVYGAIIDKAGTIFDEWRNYGLIVAVDTHVKPPEWKTDEEGNEKPHIMDNLISPGQPLLPGRRAGGQMVKAFDEFFRVVPSGGSGGLPALGGLGGGYADPWPWKYAAGPYGSDGTEWETKDRWKIAVPNNFGVLPLNLGEILRWVARTHKTKWSVPRAQGHEKDEELIAWAATAILGDQTKEREVYTAVARRLHQEWKVPPTRLQWVLRDISARVELERLHDQSAELAAYGITL